MIRLSPILRHLGACPDASAWLRESNHATFADAWLACPRPDWLLWLIAHAMPRETLVECACDIAETALSRVLDGEERPRIAIETARRWARGDATIDEVRTAAARAANATNAAYAAYANAAANAADAAANAAFAAYSYANANAAAYAVAAGVYTCAADARSHRDLIRARVPAALVERAVYDYALKLRCAKETS